MGVPVRATRPLMPRGDRDLRDDRAVAHLVLAHERLSPQEVDAHLRVAEGSRDGLHDGAEDQGQVQLPGQRRAHPVEQLHLRGLAPGRGEQLPVVLLALAQSFLGLPVLRDVLVGAQHTEHRAVPLAQGHLARAQPQHAPVGTLLRLLVAQPGLSRGDHLRVVAPVRVGGGFPRHLEVVQPDDLAGVPQARVTGKVVIAAHEAKVPVLPEHALRDVVQHEPQQLAGAVQLLFRPLPVGDVHDVHEHALVRIRFVGDAQPYLHLDPAARRGECAHLAPRLSHPSRDKEDIVHEAFPHRGIGEIECAGQGPEKLRACPRPRTAQGSRRSRRAQ